MTRLFGFECEVQRGVRDVLQFLSDKALIVGTRLHSYHCTCPDCQATPERSNPLHAQEDCTVEGEIISKPLHYGSDEADRTIAGLAEALSVGRGQPGTGAGFHVHVSHEDMDETQRVLLYRIFLRYQTDLAELASGQWGKVRDYNSPLRAERMVARNGRRDPTYCVNPPGRSRSREAWRAAGCSAPTYDYGEMWYCSGHEPPPPAEPLDFWTSDPVVLGQHLNWPHKESWLARRERTFEFRLWNSTRAEWRMRLAVGVSVAMVEAAKAETNVTAEDPRSLVEVLTPFMDAATLAGVLRQSFYIEAVHGAA